MSKDKIQKADKQELSLVVRAIGTDLEYTQVRMITSANANMLLHYWKVGPRSSSKATSLPGVMPRPTSLRRNVLTISAKRAADVLSRMPSRTKRATSFAFGIAFPFRRFGSKIIVVQRVQGFIFPIDSIMLFAEPCFRLPHLRWTDANLEGALDCG